MAAERKTCKECGQHRRVEFFPRHRRVCRECYQRRDRDRYHSQRNARISRLINWRVAVLAIIIGTYTHDYVSGASRICFYTTVYGERAVTLNAMQMCPLTWEFEDE